MKPWYIYLLRCDTRTYVGASVDPERRLRQHNVEIRGGARATRGKSWSLICIVGPFENKSTALRWEKLVKSRARGFNPRFSAMKGLVEGVCPPGKRPYEVPSGLECTICLKLS